jgi:hypothetical protein
LGRAFIVYIDQEDTCEEIAMLVANKIESGKPIADDELRNEIAVEIKASVIHGRVDARGNPTDLNGNPFVIERASDRIKVSTQWCLLQPKRNWAEVRILSKAHNLTVKSGEQS